ncbi:MAG: hypothetical protein M1828_007098 [Chrysothrix sp. TS-e1954]|nr:MAG: hypothetical protein M1828_007098 [Chrysothrix sp. TS-e1954]
MAAVMKAVVIHKAGGPEALQIEQIPIPKASAGRVLMRVKAFGLNRSELFTRQGHSPGVPFPRVLGIEAVGVVEDAPGNEFKKGDVVATAMGGSVLGENCFVLPCIGRMFDGGYAEYTCPPTTQVQKIETSLDWKTLGAIPEMLETAWGSLFRALRLQKGDHLLVRGGTTSVGLAAAAIAKNFGCQVSATTRRADRGPMMQASGVDNVFIDDGAVAKQVRQKFPKGVQKVLELVGTTSLEDSLQCAAEGGVVCMTGMVGNKWALDNFSPMGSIPTTVCLTTYAGDSEDFIATPLNDLAKQIASGTLRVQVGKVFNIDEIVEAHRMMEENKAGGKIVVLT